VKSTDNPAAPGRPTTPGSVAAKYATSQSSSGQESHPAADTQSHACFTEHAIGVAMLDLELDDGNRLALPYHDLEAVGFDPDGRIELSYRSRKVIVRGTALLPLHKALTGHRVGSVKTGGRFRSESSSDPFVKSISIQEP
jgi:hypothetical protein